MEKIFIYGTLAPGRVNEHKLSDIKGIWEEGLVKGTLYEEAWGSKLGYSGINLSEKENEVKGFLFTSSSLDKKWKELDSFEGHEYKRVMTQVYLSSGEVTQAYIYALSSKK